MERCCELPIMGNELWHVIVMRRLSSMTGFVFGRYSIISLNQMEIQEVLKELSL